MSRDTPGFEIGNAVDFGSREDAPALIEGTATMEISTAEIGVAVFPFAARRRLCGRRSTVVFAGATCTAAGREAGTAGPEVLQEDLVGRHLSFDA